MSAPPRTIAGRLLVAALGLCLLAASPARAQPLDATGYENLLAELESLVPLSANDWNPPTVAGLKRTALAIDDAGAELATYRGMASFDDAQAVLRLLLAGKQRVDHQLDQVLGQRQQFATLGETEQGRELIRNYLAGASRLIDLSGRLRYLLADAIATFKQGYVTTPAERLRLVALLRQFKSSLGAAAVADYLFAETAPAPGEPDPRAAVLTLIAETRQQDLLPELAQFIAQPELPASLVMQAAETILSAGLPQTPRPESPPNLPRPPITARELRDRLAAITPGREQQGRYRVLLAQLEHLATRGLDEPRLRVGNIEVQPGDWLLMRNPSPYNLFTDLAPGLFTHVGVVALEDGSDGIRRLVVLDLAERGRQMPVTTVDTFLKRTLHYAFLRDPDPAVAQRMAEAARQMIGDEIEFDLTFRTDRVLPLAKSSLVGKKIHTYCAGLLLICALQTDVGREAFFPVAESPAPGHTVENFAQLGMSMGDDFISPTGALFSPRLKIVGRREPMYDPGREIEEAVFDHFARQMRETTLSPRPDLFNDLRLKLAQASQSNPLLAEALSRAADVNVDLVAGAKAAAVIDTLDEIAFGASAEFLDARDSLRAGPLDALRAEGFTPDELAVVEGYRRRHAELFARLERGELSPRDLRIALVDYYSQAGKQQLDEKFFGLGDPRDKSAIQNPKSELE